MLILLFFFEEFLRFFAKGSEWLNLSFQGSKICSNNVSKDSSGFALRMTPKKNNNVGLKPNLRIQNDEKVTKKTNKQQKTALDEDGF